MAARLLGLLALLVLGGLLAACATDGGSEALVTPVIEVDDGQDATVETLVARGATPEEAQDILDKIDECEKINGVPGLECLGALYRSLPPCRGSSPMCLSFGRITGQDLGVLQVSVQSADESVCDAAVQLCRARMVAKAFVAEVVEDIADLATVGPSPTGTATGAPTTSPTAMDTPTPTVTATAPPEPTDTATGTPEDPATTLDVDPPAVADPSGS
ncbi:hypothetical protein [Demequina iriomotensis]|uniref:hypothetical protein n=1 Tax=Demequina iriomotensis TaxID=1536641 RepID=UPI0007839008|nr:hypothetical protein [Demequina iriomotensis]